MADYNINAVTRKVSYSGSSGVGPYAFTFEILDQNDIAVYFNSTALTLTTDYSVTINANGTGSVTLVVGTNIPSTPDANDLIIIVGARDIERTTDFVTAGDLRAESLNEQLDSLTIFDQQIDERVERSIKAPAYDPTGINMVLPSKADRSGKILGFSSLTGDPVVSTTTVTQLDALQAAQADTNNAAGLLYDPAGAGAQQTTVQAKLREFVSIKDFGAVGDGVTNDRAALQAALNTGKSVLIPSGTFLFNSSVSFTAENQSIFGIGNDSILKSGAGSVYINSVGFDNLSVRDLQIDGTGTNGGIRVIDGSQKFDVLNIYFKGGGQRVWLWTCDHVTVQNCTFDSTGYGVIAQSGHSSNYVLVDGNIAKNMLSDFVEANTASAPAEFWTISNNIYTGSASYPTPKTEERFVGITNVRGVIITGNLVRNSAGDAPVHLEGALGETIISNNIFDNCITSNQNGYIYLINSSEDVIISANIFLRTDASLPQAYAVDTISGNYNNSITFTNNRVMGVAAGGNLSGVSLGFQQGATTISNNTFENLEYGITHINVGGSTLVSNNKFQSCEEGIFLQRTSSSVAGTNWTVLGNDFRGTTGTNDIYAIPNTNGTGAPKRWTVQNNVFAKQCRIMGHPGGVVGSASDAEDITISNNVFLSTGSLDISGRMSRLIRFNNVFHDPAAGGGVPNLSLPNYADDTAAASGGIPVGGMYRNGSVIQIRVS